MTSPFVNWTALHRRNFFECRARFRPKELERHYHRLVQEQFRFLIPPGSRVLEMGCGLGDLLAAVRPVRGVGVDFSPSMIELALARHPELTFEIADAAEWEPGETFEAIVLSDILNDLPDVQAVLSRLQSASDPRTRVVINFYNHLWQPILARAERWNWKAPSLPQNWLSLGDVINLLELSGWEVIKTETRILWPVRTPILERLLNRWFAPLLRHACLSIFVVARLRRTVPTQRDYRCTVVVPARNEAGNIEAAVRRTPEMGLGTEILFVEGHSKDETWAEIQRVAARHPDRDIKILKQQGIGKGSAVREGFAAASGEVLMILDADLTMPPEELPKFYEALRSGKAEFVNGVRLVYPMENEAMRFLNMIANKFFGLAFSWILGQPIKDTLCGTKVIFRRDYAAIARNRAYFGDFDPFGDFDLLFGAAKLNMKIVDLPIRYRARTYGETNIQRWRHGWLLLRMTWFAARKFRFPGTRSEDCR